jgi:hypothetical protein
MRSLLLVLVTLSLRAQSLPILCEPAPETLHLLEAVPPVRDTTIPYEQRVGELRRLAQKYPRDFFIQRTYEDSFRQDRSLGEEYDRALAMYRGRPEDPLSRYYEARLLAWSMPQRAREALNEMLADNPKFVWPHLDLAQYAALPGMRADADLTAHMSAFFNACPDAFIQGMSTPSRAALERRNSPLEAAAWPALWESEQKGKPDPDILARGVRADLKPIEAWPLRSDPDLYRVYSEAARILKDPDILKRFRAKVEAEAPHSLLALRFVQDDWENTNPVPDRNAPPIAWKQRR